MKGALIVLEGADGVGKSIQAERLREWLADGKTVLLDRYVHSNVAYQCARVADPSARERLRDWILALEYGHHDLPRPDRALYLDAPIAFSRERLRAGRAGDDRNYLAGGVDVYEKDLGLQERVREEFIRLTEGDFGLTRVPCGDADGGMAFPDVIHGRIREALEHFT